MYKAANILKRFVLEFTKIINLNIFDHVTQHGSVSNHIFTSNSLSKLLNKIALKRSKKTVFSIPNNLSLENSKGV